MDYDLELGRVIAKINDSKARLVCIQLADGLKQHADDIQEALEQSTNAKIVIWSGSCYGACDMPNLGKSESEFDLMVQFGHEKFIKTF